MSDDSDADEVSGAGGGIDPQAAIIKKIVDAFKELLDCAKPPPSIVPNVTVNFDVSKIVDAIKESAGSTPRIRPG